MRIGFRAMFAVLGSENLEYNDQPRILDIISSKGEPFSWLYREALWVFLM